MTPSPAIDPFYREIGIFGNTQSFPDIFQLPVTAQLLSPVYSAKKELLPRVSNPGQIAIMKPAQILRIDRF